jgi:dTDP-glucose 4,6-dehydratase
VNFAAETHVGNSIVDSKTFIRTNVDGVRNLLMLIQKKPENIREKPVLIQISTDEVLGDTQTNKLSEEACLNPSNPYAASKAAAELLIRSFGRTYGTKYRIVRPTNNYGTHQYHEKFIPLCVRLLQENRKIRLHNFGTPIRNWIHVEDTCRAIQSVINNGENGEIYHIGGSEEKTNLSVAVKIVELYENKMIDVDEYKDYFDFGHHRPGQDMRYAINDEKLRGLGWEPSEKFDETIGQIVDFYRTNWRW